MAKGKNELDDLKLDDLDLGKFDLDLDPVNDKRKPIVKISSSFGKSVMEELGSVTSIRRMLTAALPTGYGKAVNTLAEMTESAKKLYKTAADELKPVTPDIKRAVQKVMPNAKKVLPDAVTNKLDAMSKPDPERPSAPNEEDQQNGEIASSLGEIFKTKMQYDAQQDARKGAYRQIRDQISDDQFRMGYAASAQIGAGIQRLVSYQDEITSRYQRKSLELQYRQYFATRELVRITATTAQATVAHLKGILHNTALPDFAKSNEFGKLENTLAKRLAASMFPDSQKFISQYFANFTNEMGNRVRENLLGFIDGLRGVQDLTAMAEGMDKHALAGHVLGGKAGEMLRDKGSKFLKKHFDKSKLIKHFGHKLSYKFSNVPAMLGNFAKDYTDHTQKHGAVLGTLMNFMRDILPPINEGSSVVGSSSLLRSDEAVSFNLATRQALTDVIPGFLSRIHHELVIMRTGDATSPRLSWNPTKGTFTTTKALAKDIHKHVYNKDEMARVQRYSGDFVNAIDPKSKLSKQAREALQSRSVEDALAGRHINVKELMAGNIDASPKVVREIQNHLRQSARLRADGTEGKTTNYAYLDKAAEAHGRAVSTVPGIKERISALAETGQLEALMAMGHVSYNEDGELVINRADVVQQLLNKKRASFRDTHRVDNRVQSLGGMAQVVTGGHSQASGEMLDQMRESMAGFEKTADGIIDELRGGRLVEESSKSAVTLEKILKTLETRDFSKSNMDALLRQAHGHLNNFKGKVVKWSEDGWAWVQDAAGKVKKMSFKDLAKQTKSKVEDVYAQLHEQHGDKIDAASRKARLFGRFFRRKGKGLGSKIAGRYNEYMNTPAEGFLGHLGHAAGGVLGAGFSVANLGFQGASAATRGLFGAAKLGLKGGWGLGKFGGKLSWGTVKGTAKGLHWALIDKVSDVYVDGKPIMFAALMKMGRYYVVDKDGKEVRQVNNTNDIVGPVKDRETGDYVLTPDQFATKVYYTRGQKAFRTITGGLMGAAKWIGNFYAMPFKGVAHLARKAMDVLKAAHRFVTFDTDIYVGGENKPRLYGTLMKQGRYICTTTNKEVHRADDIKGPVQDKETGNILISEEDRQRGLYNALGHKIGKGLGMLWEGAKKVAGLPMAFVKGAWKLTKAVTGTAASLVGGGLGGLLDHLNRGRAGFDDKKGMKLLSMQLKVQQSIFQLLHERMPKSKKSRKGSWEEHFLEESRKEHAAGMGNKGPGIKSSLSGALGGLGAWIKGKFGKKDEDKEGEGEDEESLSDKAQGWKDKWDSLKDTWDDLKNGKGKLSKWRKLRKLKKLRKLRQMEKLGEEANKLRKFGKIGKWGKNAWNAVRGLRTAGMVAEGAEAASGAASAASAVTGAATAAEAVGGAATAASAAGGAAAAAEVAGGAALAGEGAAAVGGTLAAIFSAPVLLAVGAVALVGVGAYLAWKAYKGRGPHDLLNVRLAQYGIEKGNSSEVKKVLALEDALSKNVSIQGTQAVLSKHGLNPIKIMEDFGVNTKDPKAMNSWLIWFKNRFQPIYLNNIAIVKQVNPKVELGNADRELKPKEKLEVLKKLRQIPRAIYQVNANPFAAQSSWIFFSVGNINAGTKTVDEAFAEAEANISKMIKDDGGKEGDSKSGEQAKAAAKAGAVAAAATAQQAAKASKDQAKSTQAQAGATDATQAKAMADAKKMAQIGGGTVAMVSNVVPFRRTLGSVLTANQCIRYKAYGLTELTNEKVKALFVLETDVLDKVEIDPKGQAKFSDDPAHYFETYGSQFGAVNTDAAARKAWIDWFKARFLPVVLQYATAVAQANPNVKILDAERYLKPDQLLDVAKSVLGAKAGKDYNNLSVWSIATSPWPSYKLNMDVKSTDINISYLKSQVAKMVFDEKKGIKYSADKGNGEKPGSNGSKTLSSLPTGNDRPNALVKIPKASGKYQSSSSSGDSGGVATGPTGGPPPGVIIKQPGNGTGGDINKIPMPSGRGWSGAEATIIAAAKMAGIDPALLGTIVNIESGFRPNAHASTSSAAGYGQFINDTWRAMLAKYGDKYGISPETSQYDPRANALMTAEYVKENMAYLKRATKGQITDTSVYLAHFMGPGGAADLLRANRNAVAAQLFPREAHANQSIFFDNARPRTVGEVIALMDKKVKTKRVSVDNQAIATTTTTTANGPKGGMGPITGLPSGNGMASSSAGAAAHNVGPTSPKTGSAAMANRTGAHGRGGLGPLTPIATTPVPSIDRASSVGDSYTSPADADTVVDNRLRVQRTATAADDQARRQTVADNKRAAEMVDILTQSHQALLSMDTTLKQILRAVTQPADRGNVASSTDTSPANGVKPARQSRGSSDMAAQAPIDVSRKTG